jgi:DNA-binding HxlR family transcriptional regulator
MESKGLVARTQNPSTGDTNYTTTTLADELEPIVLELGKWAHRNVGQEMPVDPANPKAADNRRVQLINPGRMK